MKPEDLNVKIFLDGADLNAMENAVATKPFIKGFTTNPSLMRKSGVSDYRRFSKDALKIVGILPISFEVFSDNFDDMEREARIIGSWGTNVYVKIPITDSRGKSSLTLIRKLCNDNIKVNVTAIMTNGQVEGTVAAINEETPAIVSVFAGRIADTGRDPAKVMKSHAYFVKAKKNIALLWASTRELFNIIQADEAGCNIITITPDLISKLCLFGKDLNDYSLETVQMFYRDAMSSGLKL